MASATLKKARRPVENRVRNSKTSHALKPSETALRSRANKLLDHEIDFISSGEFRRPDARRRILGLEGAGGPSVSAPVEGKLPKDLPAHLARLCESRLLTASEEQELFRRMNYLKYRANALTSANLIDAGIALMRQNIMRRHPGESDAEIDTLLSAWMRRTDDPVPGDTSGSVRIRKRES